jgi:hypothetical protein
LACSGEPELPSTLIGRAITFHPLLPYSGAAVEDEVSTRNAFNAL